jgi:hypothetical protein
MVADVFFLAKIKILKSILERKPILKDNVQQLDADLLVMNLKLYSLIQLPAQELQKSYFATVQKIGLISFKICFCDFVTHFFPNRR